MGSYANDMDRADRLARERGKRLAKERDRLRPIVAPQQTGAPEAAMADVANYEDWFVGYEN